MNYEEKSCCFFNATILLAILYILIHIVGMSSNIVTWFFFHINQPHTTTLLFKATGCKKKKKSLTQEGDFTRKGNAFSIIIHVAYTKLYSCYLAALLSLAVMYSGSMSWCIICPFKISSRFEPKSFDSEFVWVITKV